MSYFFYILEDFFGKYYLWEIVGVAHMKVWYNLFKGVRWHAWGATIIHNMENTKYALNARDFVDNFGFVN